VPSDASINHVPTSPAGLKARLLRIYRRRIVNVNINIVLAGLLALVPTTIAARLAERQFGEGSYLAITAVTFVADAVSDVAVYYVLHWIANHMPGAKAGDSGSVAYGHLSYIKDATLVQFERMCLSPLLYLIALASQYSLMRFGGVPSTWATIVGFVAAIATTRVIHTFWMLRAERLAASRQRACGVAR
jgi:hypothetical protein